MDGEGRFRFAGLPETTLEVFAALVAADAPERRSPPVTSPAGTPDLVIHLP